MSPHFNKGQEGGAREARRLCHIFRPFLANRSGNYAIITALAALPLMVAVSVAVEYADASRLRSELQQVLDASVLAGAREDTKQVETAKDFFTAYFLDALAEGRAISASFELGDGVLNGSATRPMEMTIGYSFLTNDKAIGVRSQARFTDPQKPPCITVLSDSHDALRVNSGANVKATGCEVHVHSQKNTAAFVGAGSKLDVARLCVRSTNTNVHGYVSKEQRNCDVAPDPYAGKLPEPAVPAACATTGPKDGSTYTLKPGRHCNVNFNNSKTIRFEPGLHIISGDMNINSGATVIAEGVTFYFPEPNSRIQANGNLAMTATAPATGPHKGILMFEKTSDAENNTSKRPFIFNGSLGEQLEGVIYLPNRDVTYNSTTNVKGNRITVVANTMIINSANWTFEGYSDGSGDARTVYLSR